MIVLKKSLSGQTMPIMLTDPLPESGTISVLVTSYSGDELASGNATYDDTEWTASAACGRGSRDPKSITLTAPGEGGSNITPGVYFLVDTNGHYEKVKVVQATSTSATLSAAPHLAYASGAVLVSAMASYEFLVAVYGEEIDFSVNVSYVTAQGRLQAKNEEGYVVTNPAMCPITIEKIYEIWPQLSAMQQVVSGGSEMKEKLDSVFDGVRSRLAGVGLKAEQFKATSALSQVTIYEFALLLGLGGIDPTGTNNPSQFSENITKILDRKWNELFSTQQYVDQQNSNKHDDTQRMSGRRIIW